jgi:hypothetical protein
VSQPSGLSSATCCIGDKAATAVQPGTLEKPDEATEGWNHVTAPDEGPDEGVSRFPGHGTVEKTVPLRQGGPPPAIGRRIPSCPTIAGKLLFHPLLVVAHPGLPHGLAMCGVCQPVMPAAQCGRRSELMETHQTTTGAPTIARFGLDPC